MSVDVQVPPEVASPPRRARVLPPRLAGQETALIGVIALLWVLLGIFTPAFVSASSLQDLLWRVAPVGIMACGMTMIIVTAGIDISIAGNLMVCSVILAKLITGGVNFWAGILIVIVIGGLLGALNGLLIAYGRIPAMVITFGTANIFNFIGYRIFNSKTINGLPATREVLGPGANGRTLGVPHAFVLMVVLGFIVWYYMRHFPGGRHLYAIGASEDAAALSGIDTRGRKFSAYVLMGMLVGLAAGVTIAGGTSTLDQSVGRGQELATIAAVVIGGASVLGGRGSVLGAMLGALLVQTVSSGVIQLGWPSQLTNLFVGLFIIIAVGLDLVRAHTRKRRSLL